MIKMIKALKKNLLTLGKNKIIKTFKRSRKLKVEHLQRKLEPVKLKVEQRCVTAPDMVEERIKLLQNES